MKKLLILTAMLCFVGTTLQAQIQKTTVNAVSCTFKNSATIMPGSQLKMRVDYKLVKKGTNGNQQVTPDKNAKSGYTRFDEYTFTGTGEEKFKLNIGQGESLDGPVRVQLRYKKMAGGAWSNSEVLLVEPQNNNLVIVVTGKVAAYGSTAKVDRSTSKFKFVKYETGDGNSNSSSNSNTNTSNTNTSNAKSNTGNGSNSTSINAALEQSEKKKLNLEKNLTTSDNLPPYMVSGNIAYWLERKPHDIKKEKDPSSIIAAELNSSIYPGAIVYADQYLADGKPRQVSGLDPGKVTVKVNFNTGRGKKSYRDNVVNTASKVMDAVYDILNEANFKPSVTFSNKYAYASSVNELTVGLDVDAKFLSNTVGVKTKTTSSQSTVTQAEDWTQTYFTVSIDEESDKSKYFGSNVTPKMIEEKAKNAPLAIVTSVTYGRRAYLFKDVRSSNFTFHGDEKVNVYKQKLSSLQDIVKTAKDSTVWNWVEGTDEKSAKNMAEGKSLRASMKENIGYDPETNPGKPISYTVKLLGSNTEIKVQPSGQYTTLEYKPMMKSVQCTFKNKAYVDPGGGLKMRVDYKVKKIQGNELVDVPKEKGAATDIENYSRWAEYEMGKGDSKTFMLNLGPDEYLDGPIRVQLRIKKCAGKNWGNDWVGKVYPNDDGKLYIECDGRVICGAAYEQVHLTGDSKKLIVP